MPAVTAFLLSVANTRTSLVNGLLEEVLAILEEKKMSGANDCATLLVLMAALSNDPASKASK